LIAAPWDWVFLSSSVQRRLRVKRGPTCPLGGYLNQRHPPPSAPTWRQPSCRAQSTHQWAQDPRACLPPSVSWCSTGLSVHKQCNGRPLPPACHSARRLCLCVPVSVVYGVTPLEGAPPYRAIYCLIYLSRLLPLSSCLLQASGGSSHRPCPDLTPGVGPQSTCLGGRTCTVANLKGVGDPAALGICTGGGF
jgi:hypothetical protein